MQLRGKKAPIEISVLSKWRTDERVMWEITEALLLTCPYLPFPPDARDLWTTLLASFPNAFSL